MPARRSTAERVGAMVQAEGARDGVRTLQAETVASAPVVVTPERPTAAAQALHGAVNLWPVLLDPGSVAAVPRGELDPLLFELYGMGLSHGTEALCSAIRARAEAVGLDLEKH